MANYRALADSRSRQVLFFVAQQGTVKPRDLWRQFLDVPRREVTLIANKLVNTDLLSKSGDKYSINRPAFEALRRELAVFNPTHADLSEWAFFADSRIAGQFYVLAQANAYVALQKRGRLRFTTWKTLHNASSLPVTTQQQWQQILEHLINSNMVRASRYAGVVSLYETNHRMAELAYCVNRILEGDK